jgi:hypothetical protein
MVSWATFGSYPAHDYGVRLDCSVGVILATIANKFVVADSLPKVPYRSLVDIYLDVSFFCQIISVFATILVCQYSETSEFNHLYLNSSFFAVNVSIYSFFHVWYLTKLYEHFCDITKWEEAVVQETYGDDKDGLTKMIMDAGEDRSKQPDLGGSNAFTMAKQVKSFKEFVQHKRTITRNKHTENSRHFLNFHVLWSSSC